MNILALRDTWLMFQRAHQCSVDRMLCKPEYRNAFLQSARLVADVQDEEALLWAVVNLRKKKSLPAVMK
jgi:hypothetical protein